MKEKQFTKLIEASKMEVINNVNLLVSKPTKETKEKAIASIIDFSKIFHLDSCIIKTTPDNLRYLKEFESNKKGYIESIRNLYSSLIHTNV